MHYLTIIKSGGKINNCLSIFIFDFPTLIKQTTSIALATTLVSNKKSIWLKSNYFIASLDLRLAIYYRRERFLHLYVIVISYYQHEQRSSFYHHCKKLLLISFEIFCKIDRNSYSSSNLKIKIVYNILHNSYLPSEKLQHFSIEIFFSVSVTEL